MHAVLYIAGVIAFAMALAYAITRLKEWQFARENRLRKTGHGFEVLPPTKEK
jgi:hypothetical protein